MASWEGRGSRGGGQGIRIRGNRKPQNPHILKFGSSGARHVLIVDTQRRLAWCKCNGNTMDQVPGMWRVMWDEGLDTERVVERVRVIFRTHLKEYRQGIEGEVRIKRLPELKT